jgi:carboxymethylenebutenolidase
VLEWSRLDSQGFKEEPMAVTALDVRTPDGVMDVHVHGAADAPTVIFFPDGAGIRPVMHGMAERLAATGYRVALINMFYRLGPFEPVSLAKVYTDPAERARFGPIMASAPHAGVMSDVGALLDVLGPGDLPVATVGYCMGGTRSFGAASAHPGRVVASAAFHGGNLAADAADSPHHQAGTVTGELYFGAAADDPSFPAEQERRLVAALDGAGVKYELEHYAAGHGYAVPDHPAYDAAADARHQAALEALLKRAFGTG